MRYILLCFFLVMIMPATSSAQRPDKLEDFTLPNLVTGNDFSLKNYSSAPVVVIIFTSRHCPYAQLYDQRITNLINDFESDQVRFILINPSNPTKHPQDASDKLKQSIAANQWTVPFLVDSNQRVARLLGAEKTPEVFVLAQQQGTFKTVYQGAIDDNPQVAADVNHQYLKEFLQTRQADQSAPLRSTPATGCRIKL